MTKNNILELGTAKLTKNNILELETAKPLKGDFHSPVVAIAHKEPSSFVSSRE